MAHSNIKQRRAYVQSLLEQGVEINYKLKVEIGEMFQCSHSAISADVLELTRDRTLPTPYVSSRMKQLVRARDKQVCQYCGCDDEDEYYIVEHVIPASRNGVGRAYNLVIACQTCNSRKGDSVWIPYNLDAISAKHPKWRQRVLAMADPNQPIPRIDANIDAEKLAAKHQQQIQEFERQQEIKKARRRVSKLLKRALATAQEFPNIASEDWHDRIKVLAELASELEDERYEG